MTTPDHRHQVYPVRVPFAALTADTTIQLLRTLTDVEIVKAEIIVDTTLAIDGANYFTVQVKNGSTVMASVTTFTGGTALTANTWTNMALSATRANRKAAKNTALTILVDETGTQTLPAGTVVVWVRSRSEAPKVGA